MYLSFCNASLPASSGIRSNPFRCDDGPVQLTAADFCRQFGDARASAMIETRQVAIEDGDSMLLWAPALSRTVLASRPRCGAYRLAPAGPGWVRVGLPDVSASLLPHRISGASVAEENAELTSIPSAILQPARDMASVPEPSTASVVPFPDAFFACAQRPASQRRWTHRTPYPELADLLMQLLGIRCERAGFPAAGGIYNYTLHVLSFHVDGLDRGLWRVGPEGFEARPCSERGLFAMEAQARAFLVNPACIVGALAIVTTDLREQTIKYGAYAHEFAALTAGAFLSSAYWLSAERPIGVCPLGGLDFEPIAPSLSLHDNFHLATLSIGTAHDR